MAFPTSGFRPAQVSLTAASHGGLRRYCQTWKRRHDRRVALSSQCFIGAHDLFETPGAVGIGPLARAIDQNPAITADEKPQLIDTICGSMITPAHAGNDGFAAIDKVLGKP